VSTLVAAPRKQPPRAAPRPGPATVVWSRDGRRGEVRLPASRHMDLLTDLLHSGRTGLVEVVSAEREPTGRLGHFDRSDERNFVPAGDRTTLVHRVRKAASAERREVFFTPPTLDQPKPGNKSVLESAVVWVDIDEPSHLDRLRGFKHRPHAVVASGSGGAHAYWRLAEIVSGDQCEEINRKLAAAVGADPASCNRGRIMRAPGTRNYKRAQLGTPGSWCRVVMCDLASPGYRPDQLVAGLADPKRPRQRPARVRPYSLSAEPWTDMEPAEYYRAITGLEPPRHGRVRCPSAQHEDRHPSAQLYSGPDSGWYCFSCGAGGRAPDLVAALRGWPTGRALGTERFKDCVAELRRIFGVAETPPEQRQRHG